MSSKTLKLGKKSGVAYPPATICANIVPAMRTPEGSFPLRITVLEQETVADAVVPKRDEDGQIIPIMLDNGQPKVILERKATDKKTACVLAGPYPREWLYSLSHSIMAYIHGLSSVKGRVYAVTFALNYANADNKLSALFDSGFLLLVEFNATRGMPATRNTDTSGWVISIATLRAATLQIAATVGWSDSMTTQEPKAIKKAAEEQIVEFTL